MDLYLFDENKNIIGIYNENILEYVQVQELNGQITAQFSAVMDSDRVIRNSYYFGSKDVDDRSVFWRYRIVEIKEDNTDRTVHVTGIYELFDDLNQRSIIKDKRPNNKSAREGLEIVLDGTTWSVGEVKTGNKGSANWYYETPLEAFREFLDNWRVEFYPEMQFSNGKVVSKRVNIYSQISKDHGKIYEYGDKLLEVIAEEDYQNLANAFYIRGKGESTYDEETGENKGYGRRLTISNVVWSKAGGDPVDKPYGQEYIKVDNPGSRFEDGGNRYAILTYENIDDVNELIRAGYEDALKLSRPQRQFRASVSENEIAELGETVLIFDPELDIRYKTRIYKLTRDFLEPRNKSIELGDRIIQNRAEIERENSNAAKSRLESLIRDIDIVQKTASKADVNKQQVVDIIREVVNQDYWDDTAYTYNLEIDNEYGLPAGIYSFDAPIDENPTEAIYLGAGKLLISNSKSPNGEWNWTTVMDGNGLGTGLIGTEQLDAGSVTTEKLDSDVLNAEHITVGKKGAQESLDQFLENSQKIAIENYRNALDEIATAEANAKQYADEEFQKQLTQIEADFAENLLQIENVANNAQVNSSQLRWYIDQIKDNLNSQIDGIRNGTVDIGESLLEINSQISELERALQEAEVPQDVIDRIIQEAKTNAKSVANAAEANAKSYARAEAKAAKEYADNGIAELRNYFTRENQKTLANVENVQRQIQSLTSTQNDIDRILAENEEKLGEISKALDEFDPTDFEGLVSSEDFYIAKREFENATEEYNRILSSQFSTNEETQDALNRLENSRDELTDSLQNFLDELSGISAQLDEVKRVIYTDEKGRLNVSKPGSEAHLTLDNDELSIRNNNDDRLAYFGADKMYIPTAQVNDRLYLGGRYYILIDSDGSFSINWI